MPVSYIAASLNLPLRDAWFDAADRALGFDWLALLGWMDAHATLHPFQHDLLEPDPANRRRGPGAGFGRAA
jgi:hypothetical protein